MALASDAQRQPGRTGSPQAPPDRPAFSRAGRSVEPNTISASQARAARRREALSNQQAVSAWLRELSARGR
ncbi:MAG TPA: hypothetical protein VFN44_17045 [Solirubrobacteraceae bacterium]|nr:hypothetical protein [Solirubrobacteraceae bacterium]